MVNKKIAGAQAKRLKGLRGIPQEGRDEVGAVMMTADSEGHLTRAVQHILDTQDWYPTPRGMREALEAVPKSLADGCDVCNGLGMYHVSAPYPGGMRVCSCAAGRAKVEVIGS